MNILIPASLLAVATLSVIPVSQPIVEQVETIKQPVIQQVEITTLNDKLLDADLETRRKLVYKEVEKTAKVYNVNTDIVYNTIAKCENKALDPKLQSGHTYYFSDAKRNIIAGQKERSFGLAMIHLPDHPSVSYKQATDSEFAIEWMVKEFSRGRQNQWTCYRILYGNS